MVEIRRFFDELNREYLEVHRHKEEVFWSTRMGIGTDKETTAGAEEEWTNWLSDEARLAAVQDHLSELRSYSVTPDRRALETGLEGWIAYLKANSFTSVEAKKIWDEAIEASARLSEKRSRHTLTYIDERGQRQNGSLGSLATNVRTAKSESVRQNSLESLKELEDWVLDNGFLELVETRNRFARASGFNDYFEYSVQKNEKMSAAQLFAVLDELLDSTKQRHEGVLEELRRSHGSTMLAPHNTSYALSGDVNSDVDPYLFFSVAPKRWFSSFSRLNIDFAGADLTLDLLERKGKAENGFCHAPVPAFFNDGNWIPAKVNFTSNARPDLVGSGRRALRVLFHEGGHAAHFANIRMSSPCFSHEYAPTSMALAETQSMFCESLISDADWLSLYATDRSGAPMPKDLIRELLRTEQRSLALHLRTLLGVPYFERTLYSLPTEERTPSRVKALAREVEQRIFGADVNPRPLLAVPHLLSNQTACSYQGYLLALIAVHQTRAHFTRTFGYLADNPKIGPQLAGHYWNPGNSISPDEAMRSLTGEPISAQAMSEAYSLNDDEVVQRTDRLIEAAAKRPQAPVTDLNASIRIVDGTQEIASNADSDEEMFRAYSAYIESTYPPTP